MELDELKASWQSLDRRVSQLTAINLELFTDAQRRKARWRLLPVFVGAVCSVAVGGWLASVFARFWIAHLDTTSSVIAGVALHAASVGLVIVGVVQLLIVTRINFAQPVVVIQRYLAFALVSLGLAGLLAALAGIAGRGRHGSGGRRSVGTGSGPGPRQCRCGRGRRAAVRDVPSPGTAPRRQAGQMDGFPADESGRQTRQVRAGGDRPLRARITRVTCACGIGRRLRTTHA